MSARRAVGAAFLALILSACAQTGTPPPRHSAIVIPEPTAAPPPLPAPLPEPLPLPPPPPALDSVALLPGWNSDDHLAALDALKAACAISRNPAMRVVCAQAPAFGIMDETQAKAFLEAHFRVGFVGGGGLLTAYFTPTYEARRARSSAFCAPVRPPPPDLPVRDLSATSHAAYADRAAIDRRPAADALAWMRPEDLFFMQVQGSGILVFPSGQRSKALFAGDNGAPFVGIAAPMREQGLLPDQGTSGDAIHAWLALHRGPEADAIMRLDPRYVFFHLTPDDGGEPFGAAGEPLVPGRSLAMDPRYHAMGELFWISAVAPVLSGAPSAYHRLAVALDAGGAIKGDVRADLYLGMGQAAGAEAGRVRHVLTLYELVPTP